MVKPHLLPSLRYVAVFARIGCRQVSATFARCRVPVVAIDTIAGHEIMVEVYRRPVGISVTGTAIGRARRVRRSLADGKLTVMAGRTIAGCARKLTIYMATGAFDICMGSAQCKARGVMIETIRTRFLGDRSDWKHKDKQKQQRAKTL